MKVRVTALALILALLSVFVVAPKSAGAAPKTTTSVAVPVTGSTASGATFGGTLNITRFAVQNGNLVAVGTLTGTLTSATGSVLGTVTNAPIALPVTAPTASCQILNLVLGPLDLNLLGLVVHLDTVHLNITAVPGAGNLLGNLLCSVAHLLDNNGSPLGGIAALLNQLLNLGAIGL